MAQPPHLNNAPPPFSVPPLGTVLITGGCGFLGSHIVSLLLSRNFSPVNTQIHVLDIRQPAEPSQNVTYHTADLTSSAQISALLEKLHPDIVIHTASPVAVSSPGAKEAKKINEMFHKVNVEGTRNLVQESKRVGVKAFVYTSSASVVSDCVTDLVNADESFTVIRGKLQREYYTETKVRSCLRIHTSGFEPSTNFIL